jgi:hypothetical protein
MMHLSRLERRITDAHSRLAEILITGKPAYRALRFVVSFFIILYGFAKLNGSQFTIPASELDKPMGQVSGFWLTWYYFGYIRPSMATSLASCRLSAAFC